MKHSYLSMFEKHSSIVQDPWTFLKDLEKEAQKAKERVWVQTMLVEDGDFAVVLERILTDAAKKGLNTCLTIDWAIYRYYNNRFHMHLPLNKQSLKGEKRMHEITKKRLERLREIGVKVIMTNIPSRLQSALTPIRRNHCKMTIVDQKAAWVGGVNFTRENFRGIDFMVKFTDLSVIEAVAGHYNLVNRNRPPQDYKVECDKDTVFLSDSGIPGRSIIYDEARKMLKNASREIIFASQFTPDGELIEEIIKKTKLGVKVKIVTSSEESDQFTLFPYNLLHRKLLAKIKNNPDITFLHVPCLLHAKLLCVDKTVALFGSHNFARMGIWFGTEEVAIRTTNTKLISQLYAFVEKAISEKC